METKQPETLKAAVDALGLTYSAEFVPFSKSRNAKKVQRPGDLSLNWRVAVSKGRHSIITDYMQGIANIPGHKQSAFGRVSVDEFEGIKYACEQGKIPCSVGPLPRNKPIPAPELHEVMYSLLMDSSAIDSATYEEWAGDYGYSEDSREGERIYRACLEIGLKLRAMLGDKVLQQLREAAQDY